MVAIPSYPFFSSLHTLIRTWAFFIRPNFLFTPLSFQLARAKRSMCRSVSLARKEKNLFIKWKRGCLGHGPGWCLIRRVFFVYEKMHPNRTSLGTDIRFPISITKLIFLYRFPYSRYGWKLLCGLQTNFLFSFLKGEDYLWLVVYCMLTCFAGAQRELWSLIKREYYNWWLKWKILWACISDVVCNFGVFGWKLWVRFVKTWSIHGHIDLGSNYDEYLIKILH